MLIGTHSPAIIRFLSVSGGLYTSNYHGEAAKVVTQQHPVQELAHYRDLQVLQQKRMGSATGVYHGQRRVRQ